MEVDKLILTENQQVTVHSDGGLVIVEPRHEVVPVGEYVATVVTGEKAAASIEKIHDFATTSEVVGSLFIATPLLYEVIKKLRLDLDNDVVGCGCFRLSIKRHPAKDELYLDFEWVNDSPRATPEPIRHAYLMPLSSAGGRLLEYYPVKKDISNDQ